MLLREGNQSSDFSDQEGHGNKPLILQTEVHRSCIAHDLRHQKAKDVQSVIDSDHHRRLALDKRCKL